MEKKLTNNTWDYTTGSGSFNNQKPSRLYMGTSTDYRSRITLTNNLPSVAENKAIKITGMTFYYSRVNPASGKASTFYIGESNGDKKITVNHTASNERWVTVDVTNLSNIKTKLENGDSLVNIYFCGVKTDSESTRLDMETRQAYLYIYYVYGESEGTLKTQTLNLGETQQLTINPIDVSYSHSVTWFLGEKQLGNSVAISAGTKQTSFNFPAKEDFISTYFSSTSQTATGKVILYTYDSNGNLMGTTGKPYSFTVQIPRSIGEPSVSTTLTPSHSGFSSGFNPAVYVVNYSSIKWSVSASGKGGASISKYNITFSGGLTESKTGQTGTSGKITSSSPITVTTTVTDSRGFSNQDVQTLTAYSYSKPKLTLASIKRTDSAGKENFVNGQYATFTVKCSYSSLNGANSVTAKISYLNTTNKTLNLDTPVTELVSTTNEVQFTATVTDKATGARDTLYFSLPSSSYLLYFLSGGKALGIGAKVTSTELGSKNGLIKMGWPVELTSGLNSPLPLTSGGTEANGQSGAFKNIVAPGGTITGSLSTQGTLDVQGTFSIKNNNISPQTSFIPKITTKPLGAIYVYGGVNSTDTVLNNSRFAFRQYSYTSNSTTVDSNTYDTFLLPKTEANIASGTKTDYDILTTKNYPYEHKENGNNNGRIFSFKTFKIQTGTLYALKASTAGAAVDTKINFPEPFSSTPTVVACFHATSDAGGHGKLSISVHSETTTGFTVRVNNGDTTNRGPNVSWIAIGLA